MWVREDQRTGIKVHIMWIEVIRTGLNSFGKNYLIIHIYIANHVLYNCMKSTTGSKWTSICWAPFAKSNRRQIHFGHKIIVCSWDHITHRIKNRLFLHSRLQPISHRCHCFNPHPQSHSIHSICNCICKLQFKNENKFHKTILHA